LIIESCVKLPNDLTVPAKSLLVTVVPSDLIWRP